MPRFWTNWVAVPVISVMIVAVAFESAVTAGHVQCLFAENCDVDGDEIDLDVDDLAGLADASLKWALANPDLLRRPLFNEVLPNRAIFFAGHFQRGPPCC